MVGIIKAAVVGGAGYVGGEVVRLLLNHPCVDLVAVQSGSSAGKPLYHVHTDLVGESDMLFSEEVPVDADVYFLCTGHGKSREFLDTHKVRGKVIDLGNDFRLAKDSEYAGRKFVYGLIDSFIDEICVADSVANPGCFATAIETALMPLAKAGMIGDDVHVTAVTGSTGAGQSFSATSHFTWRANNLSTYKNFSHQHLGEICESVKKVQPTWDCGINFIPYRGDFTRGIIATLHMRCAASEEDVAAMYKRYYASSPFIHITDGEIHLKQVVNTNKCILKIEKHGDYLMITSVLDNLLKGAAGQALENMNVMFGIDRTTGLKLKPSAF